MREWDGFTISDGGNGDGGHVDRIEEGRPFYNHVAENTGYNNYMEDYKWLEQLVRGALQSYALHQI